MPKEMPSFKTKASHEATIAGRELTFYAISGPMFLRLQQKLGPQLAKFVAPMAKVAMAAERGVDLRLAIASIADEAQGAIAELLEALGKNPTLAAELVLDALHDEEWNERPVKPKAAEAFLEGVDGPALTRMLKAVVAVNWAAFLPSEPETQSPLTAEQADSGARSPTT